MRTLGDKYKGKQNPYLAGSIMKAKEILKKYEEQLCTGADNTDNGWCSKCYPTPCPKEENKDPACCPGPEGHPDSCPKPCNSCCGMSQSNSETDEDVDEMARKLA